MATNILAPTEYSLSKNDRQALLASIPPKIEYPFGIVSFSALEQASKYCPELEKFTSISIEKVHEIMSAKTQQERDKFIKIYGNDGVSLE
jgi:hypothetical protein